ncbi:alpha/beta hydrolase [Nocardia callitridis]|uniref:alpha/beta hydrolase n=1 Tax=Nocardia callitridis TaxID=648753 RepID=UPI0031EAA077
MARIVRRPVTVAALSVLFVGVLTAPGHAAPDPSNLDRFYGQTLEWKPCGIASMDAVGGECADVLVPLDYAKPGDRTMTVAISRVPATDPERRRGVLVSNPGGPGGAGLNSLDLLGDVLSPEVLAGYDLIGMDPRGVGDSDAAKRCGWPVGEMIRSAGVDLLGFVHDTMLSAGMAASCLIGGDQDKLRQLTTRNTARDLDVVRSALGEQRISYFGVSYGTYLGAVFTQMFPERSDRIVLDSSIDPDRYWSGMVRDWGRADEIALDDWSNWAATQDDTYRLGDTPEQVRTTIVRLLDSAAARPIVIDGFPIDDHWLPFILHNMLSNYRLDEALAATVREIADAANGVPVTAREPRLQSVLQALRVENSVEAHIACGDSAAPTDPVRYWNDIEGTRATQPVFGALANNIQPCAFWPRPVEPQTVVRNAVPALVLQATGDPRTPYDHGVALHRDLTASRLVTLRDVRIHMTFRPDLSACVNDTINTYYREGTLPEADLTCTADQASE